MHNENNDNRQDNLEEKKNTYNHASRQASKQAVDRSVSRKVKKYKHRQTDRQTDRQTSREARNDILFLLLGSQYALSCGSRNAAAIKSAKNGEASKSRASCIWHACAIALSDGAPVKDLFCTPLLCVLVYTSVHCS